MIEILEQVLGYGFLGLIALSYMYIVSQKPEYDKLNDKYLNRKQ